MSDINNPNARSIVADSQKLSSIEDAVAPEGNLSNGDSQLPEVSNWIAGANATDEESFPTWDSGGYRGRPEPTVRGGGSKPDPKKAKDPKKNVKDPKKNVKDEKKNGKDEKNVEDKKKKAKSAG